MRWFNDRPEFEAYVACRECHVKSANSSAIPVVDSISDYSIFKPWTNRKSKKKLAQWITDKKIDLVHVLYAEPNILWASELSKLAPVVCTSRGSDVLVGIRQFVENKSAKNSKITKAYQKAFDACQAIISTSSSQANYLKAHFKIGDKSHIIRTGFDTNLLKEPEEERQTILFSRNMQPLYNHELALDAITKLPPEFSNKWEFIFVNKDSDNAEYVSQIEKRINELTNFKINFMNSLNSVEYFETLSKSKIVVMTPKSDGAPVSAMEALAAQCNLILPDLDYDQDLFSNAIYFEQSNANDLANKIIEASTANSKTSDSYLDLVDRNKQMSILKEIYERIGG